MRTTLLTVEVRSEPDVVLARQRARLLAELLDFGPQDQSRIATAVSELGRNAYQYAGGGRVQFIVDLPEPTMLLVQVTDRGPGIADVNDVLSGQYRSDTGMGIGLRGAKRLMDRFRIESSKAGTVVEIGRKRPVSSAVDIDLLTRKLASRGSQTPLDEARQQNQDLLSALEEIKEREEQLVRVNRELAETNAAIQALYGELEDQAIALRRALERTARFHSQMNHEIRTPIHAIVSITDILLDGTVVAPLPEQEKPLGFIRRSAGQLSDLVDDLLDAAKVEAGRMVVRETSFRVDDLFGSLRAMFRPLHANPAVTLVFDDASSLPELRSDEGKISQILRNLVANALKFTERGEVRVSAEAGGGGERVIFSVKDTGIGIAEADRSLLFRDFAQVETPRQRKVKGTGLGLSLSRELAGLLGGQVSVSSKEGVGSVFRLDVPRQLPRRGA